MCDLYEKTFENSNKYKNGVIIMSQNKMCVLYRTVTRTIRRNYFAILVCTSVTYAILFPRAAIFKTIRS